MQADSLPAELQGKPTGFGDEQTWGKVRVKLIPQTTAHNTQTTAHTTKKFAVQETTRTKLKVDDFWGKKNSEFVKLLKENDVFELP